MFLLSGVQKESGDCCSGIAVLADAGFVQNSIELGGRFCCLW